MSYFGPLVPLMGVVCRMLLWTGSSKMLPTSTRKLYAGGRVDADVHALAAQVAEAADAAQHDAGGVGEGEEARLGAGVRRDAHVHHSRAERLLEEEQVLVELAREADAAELGDEALAQAERPPARWELRREGSR